MAIGTTLKIAFDGNAVKRGLSGMERDMMNVAKVAAKVGLAVGAIAAGLIYAAKKALDLGLSINKMGEEASTAENRISATIDRLGLFGSQAGEVSDRIIEMTKSLARKTGVDTKVIQKTAAMAAVMKSLNATAGETGGTFDRVLKASLDMAAQGLGTAERNANLLAMALENPMRRLTRLERYTGDFTKTQKESIKAFMEAGDAASAHAIILGKVEESMGGAAEVTADASDRIKVGMQQVKESFAMGFANAFTDVPGQLDDVIESMIERVKPIGSRIGNIVADALRGDTSDLVHAAALLGESIGSAIKKGTWAGLRGFGAGIADRLASRPEVRGVRGNVIREGKESTSAREASSYLLKRDIEDIMDDFRIKSAEIMARGNEGQIRHGNELLRPTRGGESPDITLRGEEYKILKRIEENTRPEL